MYAIILLITSISAGFLGAILGIGGGLILVPVLTLVFGIHIRYAVAASLISIIATSSGAAAGFLKDHLTNLRLAVLLEVGTVLGAVVGYLISKQINVSALYFLFGGFLLFSAVMMLRRREDARASVDHPWSKKLRLASHYPGGPNGESVYYAIEKVPFGLMAMFGAGILSALLGIGSGIFKVLAMDNAMRIPMKVSSATSNFMIGVTASASAGAYLLSGDIRPEIAGPVAFGIIIGSYFGAKAMVKMPAVLIRRIFVVILIVVSVQMIYKGFAP